MFPRVFYITGLGWYHLLVFGALMLRLAWASRARIADDSRPLPTRLRHYQSQAVMLAAFAAFSLVTAQSHRLDLLPPVAPSWIQIAAAIAVYLAAVVAMRPRWQRAVAERKRLTQLLMPSTTGERLWWVVVSLLAGVGEEITWRGMQFALLTQLTGQVWLGAVLSALMFGFGHIVQGWRSAAIIVGFALVFQGLTAWTGSLYVAMLVHTAYDITAGFTYARLGREQAEAESVAR